MTATCTKHQEHSHVHGPNCGHTAVRHDGHTDYLHDGTCTTSTRATSMNTRCQPMPPIKTSARRSIAAAHMRRVTFTVQTVVMSVCRTGIMWIIS